MNSLPTNQLLRVVQTIQAERRREAAMGRLTRRDWSDVELRPGRRNAPTTGTPEPTAAPEWRPLHRSGEAGNVAPKHVPTV
jgi:hypothetical protein